MERLKELRKENRLTTTELGKAVGVANQTITNYERGYRNPDPEMLIKFADFFGVTVDYLLGRENKNLIERPPYEITDKQTLDIVKLCKAMNEIQKAQVFGYIVGLLEQAGVNVQTILRGV